MNAQQINETSKKRFGHDAISINPTAALWLADSILADTGKNVWKKISSMRNKVGAGTTFPEYGTSLFKTM